MELNERKIKGRPAVIFVTWPSKSKFALEEYIFSRFYMYQSVYFHHTTRGFECLLRKILERARDLAKGSKRFAKSLLAPIRELWCGGESQDAEAFQNLTDHTLMAQITIWQKDKDQTLSDLASRFLMGTGLTWKEARGNVTPMEMHRKIDKVEDYLRRKGLDPTYYFMEDKPEAAPYRPYMSASASEEQSSVNSIILFDATWGGSGQPGFLEISQVPDLQRIRAITDESSTAVRYYFPREHGERLKKLLE
jgi:HD superfamily phosphohydrolase